MKNKTKRFLCFAVLAVAVARLCVLSVTEEAAAAAGKTVVLGGQTIGVKLYTKGIHVLKLSDVETTGGLKEPAKKAGLKKGDYITHVDGTEILSYEHFSQQIQNKETVHLNILRNGEQIEKTLIPAPGKDGVYRAGIWVRDSTAGIGTVTFYDPETKVAGALGHGITDADTGMLLTPNHGTAYAASISSVTKGKNGNPGEINGVFSGEDGYLGKLLKNTGTGTYFQFEQFSGNEIPVAADNQVHEGDAVIYSTVHGTEVKAYNISITKIIRSSIFTSKGMLIEVKDPVLLKETGGVVCGMSGSPIVQDGRLVGAVTHVFLNNPKKGYGIFIGNMLNTIS